MTGTIFDIQRFSLHDGPGVRTTVFFKGCSLRCVWCHNPESQKKEKELMFFRHKCLSCGKCEALCKKSFTKECIAYGKCVDICPAGAREISGEEKTVEDVFSVIVRDKEYYLTSGGGVTLSGGEPLLQADFAAELLRLCKSSGISTAIETAGNVPWENIEKVLPYCDLFLYDIKAIDENKHKILTGASNKLILENAEKLCSLGKKILFRTPVVPGYNDEELPLIASFCKGNWEILAYHNVGSGKYEALCRPYTVQAEPPKQKEMQSLAASYGAKYRPTGA